MKIDERHPAQRVAAVQRLPIHAADDRRHRDDAAIGEQVRQRQGVRAQRFRGVGCHDAQQYPSGRKVKRNASLPSTCFGAATGGSGVRQVGRSPDIGILRSIRDRMARARWCTSAAPVAGSAGALVEEIVDLARNLGTDARNLGEIGRRGALDRLQSPEMLQQRALAARADAGISCNPASRMSRRRRTRCDPMAKRCASSRNRSTK